MSCTINSWVRDNYPYQRTKYDWNSGPATSFLEQISHIYTTLYTQLMTERRYVSVSSLVENKDGCPYHTVEWHDQPTWTIGLQDKNGGCIDFKYPIECARPKFQNFMDQLGNYSSRNPNLSIPEDQYQVIDEMMSPLYSAFRAPYTPYGGHTDVFYNYPIPDIYTSYGCLLDFSYLNTLSSREELDKVPDGMGKKSIEDALAELNVKDWNGCSVPPEQLSTYVTCWSKRFPSQLNRQWNEAAWNQLANAVTIPEVSLNGGWVWLNPVLNVYGDYGNASLNMDDWSKMSWTECSNVISTSFKILEDNFGCTGGVPYSVTGLAIGDLLYAQDSFYGYRFRGDTVHYNCPLLRPFESMLEFAGNKTVSYYELYDGRYANPEQTWGAQFCMYPFMNGDSRILSVGSCYDEWGWLTMGQMKPGLSAMPVYSPLRKPYRDSNGVVHTLDFDGDSSNRRRGHNPVVPPPRLIQDNNYTLGYIYDAFLQGCDQGEYGLPYYSHAYTGYSWNVPHQYFDLYVGLSWEYRFVEGDTDGEYKVSAVQAVIQEGTEGKWLAISGDMPDKNYDMIPSGNELKWTCGSSFHEEMCGGAPSLQGFVPFQFGNLSGHTDFYNGCNGFTTWINDTFSEQESKLPQEDQEELRKYIDALKKLFPRTSEQQRRDALSALDEEFNSKMDALDEEERSLQYVLDTYEEHMYEDIVRAKLGHVGEAVHQLFQIPPAFGENLSVDPFDYDRDGHPFQQFQEWMNHFPNGTGWYWDSDSHWLGCTSIGCWDGFWDIEDILRSNFQPNPNAPAEEEEQRLEHVIQQFYWNGTMLFRDDWNFIIENYKDNFTQVFRAINNKLHEVAVDMVNSSAAAIQADVSYQLSQGTTPSDIESYVLYGIFGGLDEARLLLEQLAADDIQRIVEDYMYMVWSMQQRLAEIAEEREELQEWYQEEYQRIMEAEFPVDVPSPEELLPLLWTGPVRVNDDTHKEGMSWISMWASKPITDDSDYEGGYSAMYDALWNRCDSPTTRYPVTNKREARYLTFLKKRQWDDGKKDFVEYAKAYAPDVYGCEHHSFDYFRDRNVTDMLTEAYQYVPSTKEELLGTPPSQSDIKQCDIGSFTVTCVRDDTDEGGGCSSTTVKDVWQHDGETLWVSFGCAPGMGNDFEAQCLLIDVCGIVVDSRTLAEGYFMHLTGQSIVYYKVKYDNGDASKFDRMGILPWFEGTKYKNFNIQCAPTLLCQAKWNDTVTWCDINE